MGQALIFLVVLTMTAPLAAAIFTGIRAIFQTIQGISGFALMFDVIEVLDCCLPFSLITLISTLSVVGSVIASFLIARKVAGVILSLFSPHI